jgi:hypothetical protein
VVLRLLIGEPEHHAAVARRLLEGEPGSRAPSFVVSDLVIGESYFALRHHYGVPHSRAVTALSALLGDRRIAAPGVARAALGAAGGSGGAGVMDRLIHGDYERTGAALATFDRQAARLPGAVLLDE